MGNEEVDLVTVGKPHQDRRSLIQKYDVPVERLSYEHVTRSTSVKELEHIVLILRSGEEGIFPDLINHAEKCLEKLNPKSKILRVEEPVVTRASLEPETRKIIDDDIAEWIGDMRGREKDLEEGKALALTLPITQPDVRQAAKPTAKRLAKPSRSERPIASCDYTAWDKFDADAELDRIDLRDERRLVAAKNAQEIQRGKLNEAKKLSRESAVKKLALTATELNAMAEQEKMIGNEAFRAGDYQEALIRYGSSIAINSTVNACNNRAITNVKLGRYENAVDDCNAVLSVEYDNVIALMRRGMALEKLDKKSEALVDYQTILKLEPNNKIAIAGLNRLRKPCEARKVRMKIEEEPMDRGDRVTRGKETSEICFCDRAPGFSRSPKPPPHYKSSYCLGSGFSKPVRVEELASDLSRGGKEPEKLINGEKKEQKKIDVAKKYESPSILGNSEKTAACKDPDGVESPFEFLHRWESMRNDTDLSRRAKLLRSLPPEDLPNVIGNKLDGAMFSGIIRCLETHFCNRIEDVDLLARFMTSLSKLSRFSIVRLFMDAGDKAALENILDFTSRESASRTNEELRRAYADL